MTREEYYKALAERHKQVDWNSLESIRGVQRVRSDAQKTVG